MEYIYWYFTKNLETGEVAEMPFYSEKWLGDIGEVIEVNGAEHEIVDYAEESFYLDDLIGEIDYEGMRGYR